MIAQPLMRRVRRVVPMLIGVTLLAPAAWAHLMPAQQGTLNILGNAVFAALSLPLSALSGVDDDGDGRLSPSELRRHTAQMQAQVGKRLRLYDGDHAGRQDLVMVMAEPDERDSTSTAGSTHFLVLMKSTFDAAPAALRIETDLFGSSANERQLTIKATRGGDTEAAVLSPSRDAHRFFRSPWMVLGDYLAIGVKHILGGTDHLLFLLTIIVAAVGWRYWLGVLTSFTVAHSMTLTLALFGVVRVPAIVVEPLIAASIVVMALLNLRQRVAVTAQRMTIVFACGLLHGLGFASSMADMGLHGAYRAASVVGFNVGIELGQAAFLLAVLSAGRVLHIAAPWISRTMRHVPAPWRLDAGWSYGRLASLCAALLGALWFLERIGLSTRLLAQSP